MKLSGSYTFSAPREDVWELLNDPDTLCRIIPGCERLEQIGEALYSADIKLGLAGVRGDYSGTVKLVDQQPPERYRLEGDGRGKPGFAKGAGNVELTEEADGRTTMRYSGEAQVGGPVAGIGQRLIEGAAKSIINQSLKALGAELEARQAAGEGRPETGGASSPPQETSTSANSEDEQAASLPTTSPAALSTAQSPPQLQTGSGTGLTTTDVMRGMADDVLDERPWLRWALPLAGGLALGILVGLRLGRR